MQDLILAPEAMALPVTTLVADNLNIPWAVIRKRQYNLLGEIHLFQKTGYSHNDMYINGVKPGNNVIIITGNSSIVTIVMLISS